MKEEDQRKALTVLRDAALKIVLQEATGSKPRQARVALLTQRVHSIDACLSLLSDRRRRAKWVNWAGAAGACLVLLAASLAFTSDRPWIELSVRSSALEISLKEMADPLPVKTKIRKGSFDASPLQRSHTPERRNLDLGNVKQVTGIEEIRATEPSKIKISTEDQHCYKVQILSGGVSFLVTGNSIDSIHRFSDELILKEKESMSFCTAGGLQVTLPAISQLQVMDLIREAPAFYAPAIKNGAVQIPAVARKIDLSESDRLDLDEIASGSLILLPDDQLKINFGGEVGKPRLYGLSDLSGVRSVDLRPTFFDIVRFHPMFTALFAAFTGLIGLIVGVLKALGWWESHD
jgi:hypothetical protein